MSEILGIDLSKWRPTITKAEFGKLHDAGCRFLGLRTSVGADDDATFERYLPWARARGWVVIGYHYLTPGNGKAPDEWGHRQGMVLASYADRLDGIFVDVEDNGLKWSHVIHAAQAARQGSGGPVHLYSRKSFYDPKFGDQPDVWDGSWWADYRGSPNGRWLGKWETNAKQAIYRPGPLWQMTDKLKWKRPNGSVRSVDGNVFKGTQLDLIEYLGGNSA